MAEYEQEEHEGEDQESTEAENLVNRNQELIETLREEQREKIARELLEQLPQGEGSGLDADKVDGLHAHEILSEIRKVRMPPPVAPSGGGSGEGMVKHGNEWHTLPFAQKRCQICEVDTLPSDDAPGHAVLLTADWHIHVCTEGLGEAPCGGCAFENVEALPEAEDVGVAVFLLSDKHVYVGV